VRSLALERSLLLPPPLSQVRGSGSLSLVRTCQRMAESPGGEHERHHRLAQSEVPNFCREITDMYHWGDCDVWQSAQLCILGAEDAQLGRGAHGQAAAVSTLPSRPPICRAP
jgi:hypothetical protein